MAVQKLTSGTETKPGVYTTEFWTMLAAQLLGFLQLFGVTSAGVNDKTVLLIQGAIAGLYALSRGFAKQGVKPS